jgi:hypothetical protein
VISDLGGNKLGGEYRRGGGINLGVGCGKVANLESCARFFHRQHIWNLLELYKIDIFTLYIIKKLGKSYKFVS